MQPANSFYYRLQQVSGPVGGYQNVGSQMIILSSYKNDMETLEWLAAEVMPKFA